MSLTWVDDDEMTSIANALRTKLGTVTTYKPSQMFIALQGLVVIKNDLPSFLNKTFTSYETDDLTVIRPYGMAYCLTLDTVSIPNTTILRSHALYGCRNIRHLNLDGVVTIEESALSGCEHITSLELPNVTSIGNYAFYSCFRLETLVLSGNTVCTLASDNALMGTAIVEHGGTIKVPANLVDAYKAASGWSTYASHIVAI